MELEKDKKEKMKSQRLDEYKVRIFQLEMDRTAYESNGESDKVDAIKTEIERVKKAYKAVEAL